MRKDRYRPLQPGKSVELDAQDRAILRLLQHDNRLTNLELAEKVNLSPPTCLRRVNRLRKEGVIIGDVTLIDPYRVGKNLTAIVEIALERTRESDIVAFETKIRADADVLQCYAVSGDADFLVVVCVDDMEDYLTLVRRLFLSDTSVRHIRSKFVLDRIKFITEIPLG
jgi:Lrp/AsnC family leucine-responsive transcriptional regulator